jgi:SAM-dependent methyltransferase
MTYLFGDTELAARRLRVLARAFEPPTLDFLGAWNRECGGLDPLIAAPTILDLGCGPGHTTRLLATALDRHVIGLDASDAFLYEARRLQPTRVSFQLHDVTDVAFPTPPANLMYSRFLLTHLSHLGAVFASWRANLRPGGWILLEEPESIATEVEPFRVYLDLIARSLNARGNELYIGPRLAAEAAAIGGLHVRIDRVVEHDVTDRDAATMFAWNLPNVRAAHAQGGAAAATATPDAALAATPVAPAWLPSPADLDALQQALDDLAHMPSSTSRIRWRLRQVALRME